MKKILNCSVIIFISIIFILISSNSYANTAFLTTTTTHLEKDTLFEISINIDDISVAATSCELTFDSDFLEYVKGPDNSNQIENRILYVWYDANGGKTPKKNEIIATFTFKTKKERNE